MHWLNWASVAAFGSRAEAIRLPSALGVGLGLVCLWKLLRKSYGQGVAAAGCLGLMTTRGFDYTYDARSYGLLLGFSLASLLAWDESRTAVGVWRVAWLGALALALACGVSSNYYGVLAFFPVAAGELAVVLERRKVRLGVWGAMAVGALPLVVYLPLIHHNLAEFGPHAWNKPQLSMIGESYFVLVEGVIWPVLGLGAVVWWLKRRRRGLSVPMSPKRHGAPTGCGVMARPLQVAVVVLLAYPVIGFLVAYAGAGMISARCAIPVCAGVAMAGAVLLARLGSRRAVLVAVVFLSVWVVSREIACAWVLRQQRLAFFHMRDKVEQAAAPGEKVLVGDSLAVMPLYWYGSAELRRALVFPIDFEAIHRTEPDDSGEENLWGGRHGVFPVAIDTPQALIDRHGEYVFVGNEKGWLGQELAGDYGYTLQEDKTATVAWEDLGGVFTPLAHPVTRIYFAVPSVQHAPVDALPIAEASDKSKGQR